MKRTYVEEGIREEAERLDRLEEEGALDDLPFTRLRRYAKEPSQVYAIRVPVTRLEAIRLLADIRGEQPTALVREWVLERLDDELATIREASDIGRRASSEAGRKRSGVKSTRTTSGAGKSLRKTASSKKAAAKSPSRRRAAARKR